MAATDLIVPVAARRPPFFSPARRLQVGTLIVLVALWEILSASGLVYRGVFPSTLVIGAALVRLLGSAHFWFNAGVTLGEIFAALIIGATIGIIVGMLLGSSRLIAAAIEPLINCVASTPKVILLPPLYLAFGIGVGSKIAVGSLACFFPMVIGVTAAMLQMNPVLVRVGRSFGLPWWRMVQKIYLPSLVEPIGNGLRIGIGVAIAVCLIAETRFSYAGLGFLVIDDFNRARFPEVYAVLVVIVALAGTVNAIGSSLGRRRRRRIAR
jgi:ABC-type nitrate/sulfonate/bicarbonate transport system permease component